jgi:hypothetical protein
MLRGLLLSLLVAWPLAAAEISHIHGIAIDPADPSRLLLATHHGLFAMRADGSVSQVSRHDHDLMGFSPHPTERNLLFASGHPSSGGNLGVIVSRDGGINWQPLSPGERGPVDFHQMDVSKADPRVLYGAYAGTLQVSRDGWLHWEIVAPAPEWLLALAAGANCKLVI